MLRISPLLAAVLGVSLACPPAPAANKEPSSGVKVDREKRTVTVDCKVAPRIINDPRPRREAIGARCVSWGLCSHGAAGLRAA